MTGGTNEAACASHGLDYSYGCEYGDPPSTCFASGHPNGATLMMKALLAAAAVGVASMTVGLAAQTSGRGATPKRPAAPARTASVRVSVKDPEGSPLVDSRLLISALAPAAAAGEIGTFTTGAAGTAIVPNLKDGTYRVRCEHDGFVTLEHEFTVRGGAWNPVDLVLDAAPPPPPPPAPEPSAAAIPPAGPPVMISIIDFLDKNFIGREPIKESILACEPLETVRLLQMHDGIARHVHDRVDEIIYVVAGEGSAHISDAATPLRAGSLLVVPHGKEHSFDRAGKNPLVVLSTLVGVPCEPQKTAP